MIKAPKDKVLKGYMYEDGPFANVIRRVLVNEDGLVFVPGNGWSNLQSRYKIKTLPKAVERGNSPCGWSWSGWWEKNWACASWAWCHMFKAPQFVYTQKIDGAYFAV